MTKLKLILLTTIIFLLMGMYAQAEWFRVPVIRQTNGNLPLNDILSHSVNIDKMRESDLVGYTHEQTHQLNSELRNKRPGHNNVIYVLGGIAMHIKEPRITLSRVGQLAQYKGSAYKLYIAEASQWWNNEPLYLFDEWSAYINGTYQAAKTKKFSRAKYSLNNATELLYYISVLGKNLPSNYNRADFDELWKYALRKTHITYEQGRQYGWASNVQHTWLKRVLKDKPDRTIINK